MSGDFLDHNPHFNGIKQTDWQTLADELAEALSEIRFLCNGKDWNTVVDIYDTTNRALSKYKAARQE